MNANKITAIGTAFMAIVAAIVLLWNIRQGDLEEFERHVDLDGHPRLVEQAKHTRELLEQRMSSLDASLQSMLAEFKEMKIEMKEIRACMHRIEKQQAK